MRAEGHSHVCIVSHRFGGYDGVSVEAEKWITVCESLGWIVIRAAGYFEGAPRTGDTVIAGMWAEEYGEVPPAPDIATIDRLCRTVDLVILDNAGSLWTTPRAAAAWEKYIRDNAVPAIVRHHDPPWQTAQLRNSPDANVLPLHDPTMLHVTINAHTKAEFAQRWPNLIEAQALVAVYNTVDINQVSHGDRTAVRSQMGIPDRDLLVVQPARNIPRKNTHAGLALAEGLNGPRRAAHFWLTDPVGDIGDHHRSSEATVRIHRGWSPSLANLYAAADLITLPSSWEGWGLPVVEAAAAGRPVAAGPYPIIKEIHDPRDAAERLSNTMLPATLSRLIDKSRGLLAAH